MTQTHFDAPVEQEIDQWRRFLAHRRPIHPVDVVELEDHLREQISGLIDSGLSSEEAFLVAVKRMGALDALSREYAVEHSDRLWKQLVMPTAVAEGECVSNARWGWRALGIAIGVGILIRIAVMLDLTDGTYARNASLLVFAPLAAYFAWKRVLGARPLFVLGSLVLAFGVLANVYNFGENDPLLILTALHLPVVLWLAVGVAYAGDRWRDAAGRLDFVRFSGELAIYFALIALGGAVLVGSMAMIFEAIGVDIDAYLGGWLPSLAGGAIVIAAWLVEAKQSVIENMAPVLSRLFTPLVILVLTTFLGIALAQGGGLSIARDALLAFDLLLLFVLALVLYSLSARDRAAAIDWSDRLQFMLLIAALLVDTVALAAILTRITEWGFTPNRAAVLGINLILLVNLLGSAALYFRLLRGRASVATLERWQAAYLPVYAGWAAVVVIVFPLLFR